MHFRTWSLVGEETGGGCGDRKCVFPLEQKEVEQLKYCLQEEVFDDVSPSVGSGWKLR